ncbi:MAG: ATP-binding cassette domain-containing protein [Chitinivibrionales bacterium]|nr:ATP-binding cassette domain-containing protein [Chitinivibrionales bacterium]MBD3395540.1 ATP-binding cassette domain-containing protein [Chitinivibrionales bacterium]
MQVTSRESIVSKNPLMEAKDVSAGYGTCGVLKDISVRVEAGERWAVIGRNGAGKSTLIKVLAALLEPSAGTVLLGPKPLREYGARARARAMAYVPQKPEAVIPYSVHDFVMLGRYACMGLFGTPAPADHEAVAQALAFCDVRELGDRMMTTLSGGELQRVLLAGALAQDAPILLLDEPTTFLDPAHERYFFRALQSAREHKELTVVMVTHDVNTALSSCTHVLALLDGRVRYAGDARAFKEQCPRVLDALYGIGFAQYANDDGVVMYGTWEHGP